MRISNRFRAFSLIELLMVMAVGLLLLVMAIPMFTKMVKKSKVQQTAETLITAFNMANTMSQQMARPEAVVTYFGDDFSSVTTKPVSGVLPKYSNIEIWSAKIQGSVPNAYYTVGGVATDSTSRAWVPYYMPLEPLTVEPFTFPDGIRILAGYCYRSAAAPYAYTFAFTFFDKDSQIGEIKRHSIGTVGGKGVPQGVNWSGSRWSYSDVLVFDVQTGEHLLIRATGAEFATSPTYFTGAVQDHKARILTDRTTHNPVQLSYLLKPSAPPPNGLNQLYAAPISVLDKKTIQSQIDN